MTSQLLKCRSHVSWKKHISMTRYMVVHSPNDRSEDHSSPPTRLEAMARELGPDGSVPQWISTLATDLTDDRIFSFWEAPNADSIREAIEKFRFLDHLDPKVFAIREWGPADVLDASDDDS